jgi:hypothetical protein
MRLLIVLTCLLLAGCSDSAPTAPDPLPDGQEYLFEVSYVNFAWGRQIRGVSGRHQ